MLTSSEVCELRMFYARYPFDDESNNWLPTALLTAEVRNKFAGQGAELARPLDFMPFAKREEVKEEEPIKTVEYTRRHLKRIQKALGRK